MNLSMDKASDLWFLSSSGLNYFSVQNKELQQPKLNDATKKTVLETARPGSCCQHTLGTDTARAAVPAAVTADAGPT